MQPKKLLIIALTGIGLTSLGMSGCSQAVSSGSKDTASTESPLAETAPTVAESPLDLTTTAQATNLDVPYVPTPPAVVDKMLELANVGKDDILYDLGSGDGRIVITAAQKFGTRGIGIDIDPERIREANANAKRAGVEDRVRFIEQDLFQSDFSEATVVTLYLLESLNIRLRPQLLRQLKPRTRIVSHAFSMGDWEPEKVVEVSGRTVYYWVVPEKIPENLK